MALRIDSSQNRNLYVGTGTEVAVNDGNAIITGKVGIGTTSPVEKLSVSGGNIAVNNSAQIMVGGATGDTKIGKLYNVSGVLSLDGEGNRNIRLGSTTNGEVVRIDNTNERVGIGTTLPKTSLDIVKDSDIWHLMAGGATKKLLVGGQAVSGDVVLQAGAASTPNNAAVTTAYNLCLQRDGGNVGIAVPSPTAKLHVQGAANDGIAIMGVSTTATRGFLGLDASNHGQMQVISSAAGGGALIKSIGNSYLNGGNVGIGTTSPQSKLQVAGGIQMANDTATASAAKVGTMRYRTGTEYVEVTGTELIANGEFTTDTAWTKGAGWAIANGKATLTAQGASTSLTSTVMTVTSGSIYKVVVDVVSTSTGFRLYDTLGVVSYGLGVGKNTFYRTVSSSSYQVTPLGLSGASGSIESVSVIEVTAEDASYADMCMQTGASTYEWVNIVRNTY